MFWIYLVGAILFINLFCGLVYIAEEDSDMYVAAVFVAIIWPILVTLLLLASPFLFIVIKKDLSDEHSDLRYLWEDLKSNFNKK